MASPSVTANIDNPKPVHTILLDTSPILLNTPSISTLLAHCQILVTTQSVIDEVRGEEARNRLQTLYMPFLDIRSPKPESIRLVREFARKTGDSGVLSATDYEILALAYDLECERNGGDWRLRSTPGQKRVNGSPPSKDAEKPNEQLPKQGEGASEGNTDLEFEIFNPSLRNVDGVETSPQEGSNSIETAEIGHDQPVVQDEPTINATAKATSVPTEANSDSDTDDGWITPSNIKKKQAEDDTSMNTTRSDTKPMQVATITGDFAMQNVILQMNLNLLSTKTCKRVSNIKQMILRCHGCFNITKDMSKQFCPRCGKPTLTRVTCTTNDKGEVKLHLKANHQWNNRGNVFSVPKPVSGNANQKWKGPRQGGGQGGWGSDLILAEDQKEYTRAISNQQRAKKKDLMDEDMLPSIISGDRGSRNGGRVQVGAGRTVNSRKR